MSTIRTFSDHAACNASRYCAGASCGGGMTLRTGKSGRYRYYTCATCAQQGKSACKGRSIPMDRLDTLVTERLAETLFAPDRVRDILGGLLEPLGVAG